MKAKQTAVVFIEFQNDFCKPEGAMNSAVKDEVARQNTVANAVRLAEHARQKGCFLVFCPFIYDKKWVEKNGVCGIVSAAGAGNAFQPGKWGAELIEELQPQAGEPVLQGKHALSGFTNTDLDNILRRHGIRNVALTGFLSNVCVEATARSAYDRGYTVRVIRDATAAASRANQEYVEREIFPLLGGAPTVDEFIAELE